MSTALITHPSGFDHHPPSDHPEHPERLAVALDALGNAQFDGLVRVEAPLADDAPLLRCHPPAYLARLRAALPIDGTIRLDGDTYMSPGSMAAARRGVGGALKAVDMVLADEVRNAFVAMRPPGHHAERETPMGFCLLGNPAIAVKHALEVHGLSRVALVDFDVHHGNGSQDLLWDEPHCLFISTHQMPLWPGSGRPEERGNFDNILNLPLPPGTSGADYRALFTEQVLPRLENFAPELILLSAGFDAHASDPLADIRLSEADFAWITEQICDVADRHCAGRIVSLMEGGYDLLALARSVVAHVEVLMERGK